MIGRPGVAAGMFSALAAADVNIQMIATSEVKVSCTVAQADCDRAIATLCSHFEVSSSPARIEQSQLNSTDLPSVRGAALDLNQAQLAIRYVPDKPGLAARIFQILADRSISVDMIIQSQRSRPHPSQMTGQSAGQSTGQSAGQSTGQMTRDIACTVAQADADLARDVLQAAAAELNYGEVMVEHAIAKVSIVGIGMIHRPWHCGCYVQGTFSG